MLRELKNMKPLKILALSGSMLVYGSCNDFLDVNPDNRVALDDLERAAQLLVSAYSVSSPNFTDWMSDDVTFTTGTTIRVEHEEMFQWDDVTTGPTTLDTPVFFWFETYTAISHANEVLAILESLPALSAEDEAWKRAIRAEALLTRAYGHFMLVNMFGGHFGTTQADEGVPYIKEPETTFLAGYERESVRRTYDEIEDDLIRGLELVDDTFFENSGKYHFNRNAALAFASRFYLFKRDFTRCIQYSNELLGDNPGAFVRDLTSQEFQAVRPSNTDYPRLYTSPDLAANLLLMRKISLAVRTDFAFGPEQNFYLGLFDNHPFGSLTDARQNPALVKGFESVYPLRYENLFERSSLNSNTGLPYYIHMAFTGEEVLLNRAEANTFQGNIDRAIADLQVLSERRFTGGTPELTLETIEDFLGIRDDPVEALLQYIILIERRKEFIMQGMRWWDIKRFGFSVQRSTGSILDGDDPRRVFQIPQSAIDVGGLEPNPR